MTARLFDLPREFVRNAIFSFLSLKDISKFDSTVQNTNQRQQLFEICCGIVIPIVTVDRQLLVWMKKRGMLGERIKLADTVADEDIVGVEGVMRKCMSLDIGNSPHLTTAGLCAFVEQCHSLLAFSSYSNYSFSDAVLCGVAANNCGLLEIAIEGYEVGDVAFNSLSTHCPKLEMFSMPSKRISDEAVIQLVQKCTRLVDVDLGMCSQLTDAAVIALAQHCTNLKDLNLEYCALLTDASIMKLRNLLKLCIGDCYEITEAGMIAIARNNPLLDHFEMQNCEVSPAAVAGIAEFGNKDLLTLKLSNSLLSDAEILPIIEKFRNLQVLELEDCLNLHDATVLSIANNMTQLVSLSLYHNHNFSDECIKVLVGACTQIDDLCLDMCHNLTDLAVREIALKCTKLKDLSLIRMNGLTDASVVYLSHHATTLESLHMGFPGIDCESVISLIEAAPGLVELSLEGQPPLSEDLQELIKQRHIYLLPDPAGAGGEHGDEDQWDDGQDQAEGEAWGPPPPWAEGGAEGEEDWAGVGDAGEGEAADWDDEEGDYYDEDEDNDFEDEDEEFDEGTREEGVDDWGMFIEGEEDRGLEDESAGDDSAGESGGSVDP